MYNKDLSFICDIFVTGKGPCATSATEERLLGQMANAGGDDNGTAIDVILVGVRPPQEKQYKKEEEELK